MLERVTHLRSRHRAALAAGLLAVALLSGCAGQALRPGALPPPAAREAPLAVASPAARDALEAGLRWIAADAPATQAEASPPIPPAKGGGR